MDEFKLLRESKHRPGQAARPGGEWRKALLRRRTAKDTTGHVENGFVDGAATEFGHIVVVAAFAVVDVEGRRCLGVRQKPAEEIDPLVLLANQDVAKKMRQATDAQSAHRINKQRVAAVEGVDIAAVGKRSPARGLHGSADFQSELVEVELPFV